jgi:hypothetical protein
LVVAKGDLRDVSVMCDQMACDQMIFLLAVCDRKVCDQMTDLMTSENSDVMTDDQ